MLLVMDVGNSHIKFGVYENDQLKHHWRLHTNREATDDEYAIMVTHLLREKGIRTSQINGVAIASVVPPLKHMLENMCRHYFSLEPLAVGPGVRTGLNILYENPREVGSDRIANAVAVSRLYGTPAIIVDFGTATTYCLLDEKGNYLGGVIAPGVGVATEGLINRAALLTRFEIVKPEQVLGRSTIKAMQSGVFYGYIGQVNEIVSRLRREVKNNKVKVIATGGWAELIGSESESVHEVRPFLTLDGLSIIYNRNQER